MPSATDDKPKDPLEFLNRTLTEVRNTRTEPIGLQQAEDLEVYKQTLIRLLTVEKSLGQSILAAMWKVYAAGLIMFDGKDGEEWNPEQFEEWVDKYLKPHAVNIPYVTQLSTVVTRIFQDVHKQSLIPGKAYILSGGFRLEVDHLIRKEGLVARLTSIATTYALPDITFDQRTKLLDKVYFGRNQAEVDNAREEIVNGGTPVKLPYFVTYLPNGLATYTFTVNTQQELLLKKIIGRVGEHKFIA